MAPLESASLLSDLRREPHTLGVEVEIDGSVDTEALREAVVIAAARHPMTRVTATRTWLRPTKWALHEQLDIPITEHSWGDGDAPCTSFVDIARAPFELHVQPLASGRSLVQCAVNHAAFDGIGAVRVVRSILAASNGETDPLPEVDPIAVRNRQRHEATAPAVNRPERAGPANVSHLRHRSGPAGAWLVARSANVPATVAGATVNDQLQAAFHLVLAEELGRDAARVRTLMPLNARPSGWADEVVGNHAWLDQLDTAPEDRRTFSTAVEAIAQQTAAIRHAPRPDRLFELLGAPWMTPLLGRAGFHAGARLRAAVAATGSVSNLGVVARLPDFAGQRVSALRFSPPCRAPRGIALGAVGYEGRLQLTLRVLQRVGSQADADRWIDRVIAMLDHAAPSASDAQL